MPRRRPLQRPPPDLDGPRETANGTRLAEAAGVSTRKNEQRLTWASGYVPSQSMDEDAPVVAGAAAAAVQVLSDTTAADVGYP